MSLQQAQEIFDKVVQGALDYTRKKGHKVACARGCSACCIEPVYAERREAVALVEALVGQREEIARRTEAWWDAFFGGGFNLLPRPRSGGGCGHLLSYRSARLACPILHANLCAAYASRPIGCRSHLALHSKKHCEDDRLRMKQEFVQIEPKAHLVALYAIDPNHTKSLVEFDHLGIWLGHILLGKTDRSAAAEDRFLDNVAIEASLAKGGG